MPARSRLLLGMLLTGLSLGASSCAQPAGPNPGVTSATPGKSAADARLAQTRLPDLLGRSQTLAQYLAPRGLLVVIVDLNCPASEQTLTELPAIASKLATRFGLPAVVVDVDNEADRVQRYYQAKQLTVPVVYDQSHQTTERWRLTTVPALFLFDGSGKLTYQGEGQWDPLKPALAGQLGTTVAALDFGAARGPGFG